jgi:hypothetical protein
LTKPVSSQDVLKILEKYTSDLGMEESTDDAKIAMR